MLRFFNKFSTLDIHTNLLDEVYIVSFNNHYLKVSKSVLVLLVELRLDTHLFKCRNIINKANEIHHVFELKCENKPQFPIKFTHISPVLKKQRN